MDQFSWVKLQKKAIIKIIFFVFLKLSWLRLTSCSLKNDRVYGHSRPIHSNPDWPVIKWLWDRQDRLTGFYCRFLNSSCVVCKLQFVLSTFPNRDSCFIVLENEALLNRRNLLYKGLAETLRRDECDFTQKYNAPNTWFYLFTAGLLRTSAPFLRACLNTEPLC
jgi:hypothetical protein